MAYPHGLTFEKVWAMMQETDREARSDCLRKLIVSLLPLALTLALSSCGGRNTPGQTSAEVVSAESGTNIFAGHENDAALFAETYPVSEENPFIIASFDELAAHLKWGTGVIVFGFPDCPRCRNAFPVLEKAFGKMNMGRHAGFRGKILYYDFFNDRETNNERYLTIVDYIKGSLPVDSNGNPRLYSPDVFFIAAGKVVGNHLDTVPSLTNPRDSLNEEQEAELLKIYMELIEKVEDCGC